MERPPALTGGGAWWLTLRRRILPGWDQVRRISCENSTDAIIWETHVRDFSESPSSGMVHRGQYLAFTETDTTVNGEGMAPTGISYLKYLGITPCTFAAGF